MFSEHLCLGTLPWLSISTAKCICTCFVLIRLGVQIQTVTTCSQKHYFWDLQRSLHELWSAFWEQYTRQRVCCAVEKLATYGGKPKYNEVHPLTFNHPCCCLLHVQVADSIKQNTDIICQEQGRRIMHQIYLAYIFKWFSGASLSLRFIKTPHHTFVNLHMHFFFMETPHHAFVNLHMHVSPCVTWGNIWKQIVPHTYMVSLPCVLCPFLYSFWSQQTSQTLHFKTSVCFLVLLQTVALIKHFSANITTKWFFSCMYAHVCF